MFSFFSLNFQCVSVYINSCYKKLTVMKKSLFFYFLNAVATIALAGCGGDSTSNSDSDPATHSTAVTIKANNFSLASTEQINTPIHLSELDVVTVSDNSDFIITSVEPLLNTDECAVDVQPETASFTVNGTTDSDLIVCDYHYTVDSASKSLTAHSTLSGISRIVIGPRALAEPEEMAPVSAVVLAGKSETIDLTAALNAVGEDVSGLNLMNNPSHVYASRGKVNSVDSTAGTLSYTAPASPFTGIDRVLFSYSDGSVTKLGHLDIAITDEANKGLSITPQNSYAPYVTMGENEITIDVTPYVVADHDGNGFFLKHVDSFYADVALSTTSDTSFTFKASRVGYHYVSFAVADGQGAFEMGMIKVAVVDPNQVKDWQAQQVGLSLFSAPFTSSEAYLNDIDHSRSVIDDDYTPPVSIATFVLASEAEEFCKTQGRLPTSDELLDLADFDPKTKGNWPTSYPYLAADDESGTTNYSLIDLTDGTKAAYSKQSLYIVSCIKNGMLSVRVIDGEADADGEDKNTVEFTVVKNREPYVGIIVKPTLSSMHGQYSPVSSAKIDKASYTTDDSGKITVNLTSSADEITYVTLKITENGVTESVTGKVWFGPLKTIHMSSIRIDQNDGNSEPKGEANSKITQVTGTVADNAGTKHQYMPVEVTLKELDNPDGKSQAWVGKITDITTADEIVAGVPATITDSKGEASVSVSNYGGKMKQVEVTMTYNPPLGSAVGVTQQTAIVSFCEENSLPVKAIETSDGKLFLASPREWVVRACGIPYGGDDKKGNNWIECEDKPWLNGNIEYTGPCGVSFAMFKYDKAKAWCRKLSEVKHLGKANWRLPKNRDELNNFYKDKNVSVNGKPGRETLLANGWTLRHMYWTQETNTHAMWGVRLYYGNYYDSITKTDGNPVTCVSDPDPS